MNYKLIAFVYLSIHFYACKAQKCDDLYKFIFTDTAKKNVFNKIHSMGKDAIPCLIEFIDVNKKSFVGFQDPSSSNISSLSSDNYIGIEAAYLIEFILSKDSIEMARDKDWDGLVKPYKIFGYGVIVKNKENKPVLKPLEYRDMIFIKGIYLKWWQLNKEKPIDQLRKYWKKNGYIINSSSYKWI